VSRLIKVDEMYYDVREEERDHYICFPLGGGFQCRIPKTAAEETTYSMDWAPAKVAINTEEWFDCMMDHNSYWNGWREPYFEKPEMLRFLKAEGFTLEEETEHRIQFFYDDGSEPGSDQRELNTYEARKCEIDGTEYWTIDGWCFVAKESDEETERIAG